MAGGIGKYLFKEWQAEKCMCKQTAEVCTCFPVPTW